MPHDMDGTLTMIFTNAETIWHFMTKSSALTKKDVNFQQMYRMRSKIWSEVLDRYSGQEILFSVPRRFIFIAQIMQLPIQRLTNGKVLMLIPQITFDKFEI